MTDTRRSLSVGPSKSERLVAFGLLAVVLLIRIAYIYRYRVDSDEPQHLHVSWQWAVGLISYRDFFDNHTPLFHIVTAPVMWFIGERADVLGFARLAMVPFYLLSLWAIALLGRSLFSARVGLWSPLFVGIFPNYMFPTVEFRTDNMWAPIWLIALAVLFGGRPSLGRTFGAGLLVGMAFATSMKTSLLVGTLAVGALGSVLVAPTWSSRGFASLLAHIGSGVVGLVVVPGLLLAFFWMNGAMAPLLYCIFDHNVLPAGHMVENRIPKWALLGVTITLLLVVARALFVAAKGNPSARSRVVLFLHAGITIAVLEFAWPVMTRQNFLPVYPLAMMFLVALIVEGCERASAQRAKPVFTPVLASIIGVMIVWTLLARSIAKDQTQSLGRYVADALRLTEPGEHVMTYKGEVVFRRRPYYYVLEPFTRARLGGGLLKDDIAERLVETRTYVAMTSNLRFPAGARQFLADNYLPVGLLRVVGKNLPAPDANGVITFDIAVPAEYVLLRDGKSVNGPELDGKPLLGSAMIEAGRHQLRVRGDGGGLTLLWKRAVERGFSVSPPGYEPERIGSEF